jgi:hypothetical protein
MARQMSSVTCLLLMVYLSADILVLNKSLQHMKHMYSEAIELSFRVYYTMSQLSTAQFS